MDANTVDAMRDILSAVIGIIGNLPVRKDRKRQTAIRDTEEAGRPSESNPALNR